jgi:large subunit ribosomal protein L25
LFDGLEINDSEQNKKNSMKTINIQGTLRSDFGKKATRQVRSEGHVPCVIYGGDKAIHFSAPILAFRGLVYTAEFQIAEINIDGVTYRCILKDLQFDVVTDALNHIDFLQLVDDKKVIANLPLKFVGTPAGVKAGGRLEVKAKTIKVRTLPKFLKEFIEVNIETLELNANVRVQDIQAPDMEIMNSPRIPIASVVMTRALRQAESEEAKSGKK